MNTVNSTLFEIRILDGNGAAIARHFCDCTDTSLLIGRHPAAFKQFLIESTEGAVDVEFVKHTRSVLPDLSQTEAGLKLVKAQLATQQSDVDSKIAQKRAEKEAAPVEK